MAGDTVSGRTMAVMRVCVCARVSFAPATSAPSRAASCALQNSSSGMRNLTEKIG
jgi:hypothetical protein